MNTPLKSYTKPIIAFCMLVQLLSCSKTPSEVLTEQEMRRILVDIQIAETMISSNRAEYSDDNKKEALFAAVFRKHNTNQTQYDSSLVWYGKNLDILMPIYNLVIDDFNKKIADLGDIQSDDITNTSNDSIDIWPRKKHFTFKPNNIYNGTSFSIKPKHNDAMGTRLVFEAETWGLGENSKHKLIVKIFAEHKDTVITAQKEINSDGQYQIELQSLKTERIRNIYGSIFFDQADSTYHAIYLDNVKLMKYKYK